MKSAASLLKARIRSFLVIVALSLLAMGAYGASCLLSAQTSATYAVIHASDGSQVELSLDQNDSVTISTEMGTNVVAVSDGRVHMVEADCPNHDCIKQGFISECNQQIVCLPHKLWIEIVGAQGGESFDATTR